MFKTIVALPAAIFALAFTPLLAAAETLVESDVDSRVTLAFKVRADELQKWLPNPWQVDPFPEGGSAGANLLIVFFQKLISQAGDGNPSPSGGSDRGVAFAVPAKHAQSGEQTIFVIRIYSTDHASMPGPYKNSIRAKINRELILKGADLAPGSANDNWDIELLAGGTLTLRLSYERSIPARIKAEQRPRSALDPNFFRIYRVDQGIEVVKSIPAGVDKLNAYDFRATIPELAKLFDRSEQLVSSAAVPWYVREVFLP